MTKPILTPTEYAFLGSILSWSWSAIGQEFELCSKEPDYSDGEHNLGGLDLRTYVKGILDNPDNEHEILTMIHNLQYKLNHWDWGTESDMGNSWETLKPLVDYHGEYEPLEDKIPEDDNETTIQTAEGYKIENIHDMDKRARLIEDGLNPDAWTGWQISDV